MASTSTNAPAQATPSPAEGLIHRRLLHDIAELHEKPYPNIKLHLVDLTRACLVLSPEGYPSLHLTVEFGNNYPLAAPTITIQTKISHPNIFGEYICASILNREEGYTPAYTLKGICIQLLSFFGSDTLDQDTGYTANLQAYKSSAGHKKPHVYQCAECGFGLSVPIEGGLVAGTSEGLVVRSGRVSTFNANSLISLPDEILLEVISYLDFEELVAAAQACSRISDMITRFDLIRSRELQCFVLKETYSQTKLGVGIVIRQGKLESEFDLLSQKAFDQLQIRKSVHGLPFTQWLPLPISYRHWDRVQILANGCLRQISRHANLDRDLDTAAPIFAFMNDIVVRLNLDLERQAGHRHLARETGQHTPKSTLRHASEKAIESYFHLFHLLLCVATGPGGHKLVGMANAMIRSFMAGKTNKQHVPNLGYLLIALLISDIDATEALMKDIITEAITRNVVWLLDGKGAGMAELGYLEEDEVSHYRLKKTFEGSRTSYRLLMFSELFRRIARPAAAAPPSHGLRASKKSLVQLRDELFDRHGAPPVGAAAFLSSEVRRLQQIDDFPSFLREMGIQAVPSARGFTAVLRQTVQSSSEKGYTCRVPEHKLVSLRLARDPEVNREAVLKRVWEGGREWECDTLAAKRIASDVKKGRLTFFPQKKSSGWSQRRGRGDY
ncbi:hypothetical protein GQ53DRAFT_709308 [Thozetella sp. PMI_491]|nr:hypothetical protein GQ53DRAFT_709308 [Thozetella sp. PMI_491]